VRTEIQNEKKSTQDGSHNRGPHFVARRLPQVPDEPSRAEATNAKVGTLVSPRLPTQGPANTGAMEEESEITAKKKGDKKGTQEVTDSPPSTPKKY